MLKTVVLLNIFEETIMIVFQDSLMYSKERHLFDIEIFCNIIKMPHCHFRQAHFTWCWTCLTI